MIADNAEHLVWTVRSIASHYGVTVDQQRLRHLAVEVESQETGAKDSLAENLGPIARHFGFRVSQFQATVQDIHSLLDESLPVVVFLTRDGVHGPVVLRKRKKGAYLVDGYLAGGPKWIKSSRLGLEFSEALADAEVRLPVQVAQQVAGIGHTGPETSFPLIWLWRFLKPERPDFRIILLFAACVSVLALATPITVEALVNTVAFGRYFQPVLVLSLILFVLLGFRAVLIAMSTWIVEVLQRRMFIRVVSDLTFRLPKLQQTVYDKNYVPELVNRFFDVMPVQKAVATFLLDGIMVALQIVIGMAVLAFYHPALLGYDLVLLFFITVYLYLMGRGAINTAKQESKYKYKTAAWLEEITRAPNAFRRNAGFNLAEHRSDELAQGYLTARIAHFRILIRQIVSTLGIQAVAATALLALGGWLVIQGGLTLGQLVAAELIVSGIMGSVAKLGKHIELYYDTMASADKLRQLLELPIVEDGYYPPVELTRLGEVQAQRVACQFDKTTLRYPDFLLPQGGSMAIVGSEGTGKTALLQTIAGLRMPSSGQMRLAGVGTHELNFTLIDREIGYCSCVEVVQGTIAENVHLDRANVRSADVRSALEMVGLLADVEKLPKGIDTELACTGQPLTETQCLRLMLARAIVERPRLLLVDGTFDRLSDDALAPLVDRFFIQSVPWTTVVVTGRHAVRQQCDQVLDLDHHQIGSTGKS